MSKVKINSAKAGKRMLTVKWAKPSPAQKVDGYQVSWRINKKSAKWTTKDVAAPKSSLAIKKLKKGSRYQLRIRPYRIENGSKVYGQWSSAGSKKIK
jgi:hypothetical protein